MFSNIKSMSKEEVQQLLSTDFVNGLDKGAVIARTKKRKEGRLSSREISFFRACKAVFGKPSFFMFSLLLILSFFMTSIINVLFLFLLGTFFYLFLLYKQYTTKINMFRYFDGFSSSYSVVRSGKIFKMKSSALLEGDILLLTSGDVVPTLCYVVSSSDDFSASENDVLLEKDTRVLQGNCRCAICRIDEDVDKTQGIDEGFVSKTKKQSIMYSCVLYISFLLFMLIAFLRSGDGLFVFSSFFFFVVLISGSIFENVDFFLNVVYDKIFVGKKEENKLSVVNGFSAIDKIAELDCVCLDGELLFDGARLFPEAFYCDNRMHLFGANDKYDNPFFEALAFSEGLIPNSIVEYNFEKHLAYLKSKTNFVSSSYRLKDTAFLFDTIILGNEKNKTAYVKGDITKLLSLCTRVNINGKIMPLDDGTKDGILKSANEFYSRDYIICAYATVQGEDLSLEASQAIHKKMTFCGFLVCKKKIGRDGMEFLEKCISNDIQPLIFMNGKLENIRHMFQGNNIISGDEIVDCRGIDGDLSSIKRALNEYNVFLNASTELVAQMQTFLFRRGCRFCVLNSHTTSFSNKDAHAIFAYNTSEKTEENARAADVILNYGLASVNSVFSKVEAFIKKINMAFEYSLASALLRLAVFFLGVFSGNPSFELNQILLMTFVFDFTVISLVVGGEVKNVHKNNAEQVHEEKIKNIIMPCIAAGLVALASLFAFLINERTFSENLVCISFAFFVLFSSSHVLFSREMIKKEKSICYFWAALLFLLACVFLPFVGTAMGFVGGIISFLAAAAVWVVFLISKSVIKNIKI